MKKTNLLAAVAVVAFVFAGCTTREITLGDASYKSRRFGVTEKFGAIEVRSGTNSLRVDGVQSDLVTGLKIGAQTALDAAAKLRP